MASWDSMIDRAKVATYLATDRPHVLRQAIYCCRNFGTVSIVGVYGGYVDWLPMGSAINRGLTPAWRRRLSNTTCLLCWTGYINGEIDPFVRGDGHWQT
jgi:threonine dehydrogenase-like Zn-dependent dehydrogenase